MNNPNSSSQIVMQPIGKNEIDLLVDYRMAYLSEMQGDRTAEYQTRLKHELTDYFAEALNNERLFGFIAKLNAEIVSFGVMILKKIPGDFNQTTYLEGDILNMYTVPEARRKGYSALILEYLLKEAGNRGVSKISLHTSKDGEKLYRKYGFNEPIYPVLELSL
jgi:GNAT superfamily N-acetyltransferase